MFNMSTSSRMILFITSLMLVLACNAPGSVTPTPLPPITLLFVTIAPVETDTPAPVPLTETPTGLAPIANFKVAVIVDTLSEPVTEVQAQNLVADADPMFRALTGFGFEMVDFIEDGAGGTTTDMVNRYIQSYASVFPHGVIVFSYGDNGDAKLYGGYGYAVPGAAGFHNTFVSPATGDGHVYVAVVHFSHKYAACGYGGLDTVQSAVSIDGECRNQPDVACVEHNGYSKCADAVDDLYSSTPTYFAASSIIHEFLHPFSPGGNEDHYATPQCNAVMGWPEGNFVFEESQYYNGLCPFVYQNFINSYQP